MRKIFIILSIISLSFLASCEIETSDNGKLDGFWLLDQVDTLNNDSKCNYVDHRITWSFQYNLLQLSNLVDKTILYKFEKTGNVLKLNNPCMFDRSIGDTLITDVDVLRQYGVNSLNESFTIMDITNSKMVLESDKLRLHFVKH